MREMAVQWQNRSVSTLKKPFRTNGGEASSARNLTGKAR
jgi:hypothetical protein